MVRDRIKELKTAQANGASAEDNDAYVVITEVDTDLEKFHKFVTSTNEKIEAMNRLTEDIKRIHLALKFDVENDSEEDNKEKYKQSLDDANNDFKMLSKKVREDLNTIKNEIVELDSRNETRLAAYRIRTTQFNFLQQKVIEVIENYNKEQNQYREKCKDFLKLQLKITGQDVENEDIDTMLENPNHEIFIQGIITQTKMAKQQLREIEERHADIIKIEKSIRELYELFMDMAQLVDQQGEIIDRIETQVQNTYDYVGKGKEETKKALEYQTKSRKLKFILIAIISVILVVIILSIFNVI